MKSRILSALVVLTIGGCGAGASTANPPPISPLPVAAPDPDSDHDTVLAADDFCPDAAEDLDGCNDEDGCPDPDDDGDGVLDAQDRCPGVASQTQDGCPSPGTVVVTETDECFIMLESVYFDRGSDQPRVASGPLLDTFAAYLRRCPDILRLGIRGGGDVGELPADLPTARATVIRNQLIARGVDARRLVIAAPQSPIPGAAEGSARSVSFDVQRSLHCPR